jgi:superfamily II DNA/RNA helicase
MLKLELAFLALVVLTTNLELARAFLPANQRTARHQFLHRSLLSSSPILSDATLSNQTFADLYTDHMPDWLIEKCVACGWTSPTLIQQRALDTFFFDEPNSLVIQAQTGSGKTLTYLLPLLSKLEDRAAIQAMIVVPTRELGLQVATVAKRLASRKFMIMSILQGSSHKRQRAWAWAETPQVVIGTPSELLDMVHYAGLPRINSIEYVVVDEVDACLVHSSGVALGQSETPKISSASSLHVLLSKHLSPTFMEEEEADPVMVDASKKPRRKFKYRQTVFCSATIPQHRYFLKQCKSNQWTLEEPVFVCTSPGEALPPTLEHGYMVCNSKDKKFATLRRIVSKLPSDSRILVFCDMARPMEEMALSISEDVDGVYYQEGKYGDAELQVSPSLVSVLRLENSLSQRAGATSAFASTATTDTDTTSSAAGASFRLMLTTDLAARGLDIDGITHVIHFDLPPDADTYLHRAGRTGRLGRRGQVVTILTPDQEFVLERLANALTLDIPCIGRQKRIAKAPMEE